MAIINEATDSRMDDALLKVFVVDDHPLMRRGYRALLRIEDGLCVCGEAESAEEAMIRIPLSDPDLVIVDVSMNGMNGLDLVRCLHNEEPALPILVSSSYERELYGPRARQAGARGYIEKCELLDDGISVIQCLLGGGTHADCRHIFSD